MRWLDMYIDALHQSYMDSTVGSRLPDLGPFSRVGSIFNVIFCAGVVVVTVWLGISGQGPGFVVAAIAGVLEVAFVRVCIRAFRGDFEEYVISPEDADSES